MRVFITYRRSDFGGNAHLFVGRLADSLELEFGEDNVFYDIESIPSGQDFEAHIGSRIAVADAVLVVIGPNWLNEMQRRADDDEDFVRIEISEALRRGTHLIPIPVDEVDMPGKDKLPISISRLTAFQEFRIRTQKDFKTHIKNLNELLDALPTQETFSRGSLLATRLQDDNGNSLKFFLRENGNELSYGDVLNRWIDDDNFYKFFESLIVGTGFSGYFWESPSITRETLDRQFEFVVIKRPTPYMQPDRIRYAKYFDSEGGDHGVVTFANLHGDALLVVPSPLNDVCDYSTLSAFLKEAPMSQRIALWRTVGRSAKDRLSDKPLWISVAGGGVNWLHVRLDTEPKYYLHDWYRIEPLNTVS